MKKRIFIAGMAALLFACNSEDNKIEETKVASSTDSKKEWVPIDSATAMQAMITNGTPGEQHAMLAKADGKWDAETTMWSSADGTPMTVMSTAVNEMIMGGRYQRTTFSGDFGGMPFEGTSITAYDNAKKMYTSSWIDNQSTGIMHMEGQWDDASKSIVFKGKTICANNMEMDVRETFKIIDDNTHLMEMFMPDPKTGKEFKTMSVKFTRK